MARVCGQQSPCWSYEAIDKHAEQLCSITDCARPGGRGRPTLLRRTRSGIMAVCSDWELCRAAAAFLKGARLSHLLPAGLGRHCGVPDRGPLRVPALPEAHPGQVAGRGPQDHRCAQLHREKIGIHALRHPTLQLPVVIELGCSLPEQLPNHDPPGTRSRCSQPPPLLALPHVPGGPESHVRDRSRVQATRTLTRCSRTRRSSRPRTTPRASPSSTPSPGVPSAVSASVH